MKGNYETPRFVIKFAELGDYEDLTYYFDTYKEAKKKFDELEKEYNKESGFFGWIAEIKLCRSLDEDEKPRHR